MTETNQVITEANEPVHKLDIPPLKETTENRTKIKGDLVSAFRPKDKEGYISRYIIQADQKAALLIGALGSLYAYLIGAGEIVAPSIPLAVSLADVVTFIGGTSCFIALALAFWAVVPRTSSHTKDLASWVGISQRQSFTEFLTDVRSADEASIQRDEIALCYSLAIVCKRKHLAVRWAMYSGAVAALFGLAALAS